MDGMGGGGGGGGLGPASRAWLRRVTALDHFKTRMGAGNSDGTLAVTRVLLAKVAGWALGPGAVDTSAVNELLQTTAARHPPAPITEEDVEEHHHHERSGASTPSRRARKSETDAKLCV